MKTYHQVQHIATDFVQQIMIQHVKKLADTALFRLLISKQYLVVLQFLVQYVGFLKIGNKYGKGSNTLHKTTYCSSKYAEGSFDIKIRKHNLAPICIIKRRFNNRFEPKHYYQLRTM